MIDRNRPPPAAFPDPEQTGIAIPAASLPIPWRSLATADSQDAGCLRATEPTLQLSHASNRITLNRIAGTRQRLSFRPVNRRDAPGYEPGLQRHHILPRQILRRACFHSLLDAVGRERLHFDDFRHNGLLLPANDAAAVRIGLPLHRGPHRDYNAMVIERVGQIEGTWSSLRPYAPEVALAEALAEALEGLRHLQHSLRRQLLDQQHRLTLNRRDPLRSEVDFTELDAMADLLWPATAPAET